MAQNGLQMAPKWPQNCLKWPQRLQCDFRKYLHRNSAPVAVVLSGRMISLRQFWVWGQKWPQMVSKWPQNNPEIAQEDLNGFKVTSETISIEIVPFLRSLWIWVITWRVCNKFEFGDKNGPKLPRNGPKWPKIVWNSQKWLKSLKKTRIDLVYVTNGPFWSLKGGWVTFFQSRGQNGPRIQFCHREFCSKTEGTKLLPPLILGKASKKNRFF